MIEDNGASAAQTGPSQAEPEVSALRASVPSAEWEWWAGPNDEFYQAGPCMSREEAIEEGLNTWDDVPVHIIEAVRGEWPAPCAVSVIDHMFENSDDLFSEDYPEPLGTKADMDMATADLQCLLDGWMSKWRATIFPTPTAFRASRNREVVLPPILVAAEAIAAFASGIEARQGGDGEAGSVHESPSDAQPQSPINKETDRG